MGRSDQENPGMKDFMGLGKDTASCVEATNHVYVPSSHMRGQHISKQMYMDKLLQPNVDPHMSSQHYAEAMAVMKSNILDSVQRPAASSPWLYNNNGLPQGSCSAFAAMGRPDWNNPGGRQQFFAFNGFQEHRGSMEKVNDAYQIMHARGPGNLALKLNFPANCAPDPTAGSGMRVFPFVAPLLHEQASTMRVHQIPISSNQAQTLPLLVGEGPSARMQLAESTIMQPAESSIKPNNAQLTIFYAGRVNVYNDVSSIKAQEIMLMAASGSSLPSNMDVCSGTSVQIVTPPLSKSRKNADAPEFSQIDLSVCQPDEVSRDQVGIGCPLPTTSISQPPKVEEICIPATQSTTYVGNEPACPQALPQARKASLTRFLERRKERVLAKSPYPVEKSFL